MANEKILQVVDLCKSFHKLDVLKHISVDFEKNEVVSIIGPSGGGKSTFLRCLNLLETPTSGQILFDGVDITDKNCNINLHRQKMGMVFQHFNLFPHMTILKNMTIAPMQLLHKSKEEAEKTAMELLETYYRTFQQEAEKIGAKLVWEEKLNIHAYETPLTSDAARHYESAVAEEGLTAAFEKTFGGSDNNVFAQHGIEGLVIATSMNQVHSCAEYTKIPEIAQVARIVANLAAPQEA